MPLWEILRLSIESLLGNRFRTGLTMLGMIIGVAAVVLLVSIGNGAKRYILNEFEDLGTNLLIVQPGKTDRKGSFGPPMGGSQSKMTIADVVAIEKRANNIEAVSGIVFGTATVKYNEAVSNVNLFGSNELFPSIINLRVGKGQWYTREEDDYGRRVVLLGRDVAINLFGNEEPIGRSVLVNQSDFKVIGVMATSGNKLGMDFDQFVFVPTHAALRLFNDDKLFGIRAKARSRASVADATEEMREILIDRRNGDEDFTIITQGALVGSLTTILNMLTYVLAAIAGISMLVGGIGVMNIMLVTVAERTSEIGVRRAVGARRRDILMQFLAEAVTLSMTGGILGLLLASSITQVAYWFVPSFDLRAPYWIMLPAFAVSVTVGVVFGVWPARKASRIETLDALRYE